MENMMTHMIIFICVYSHMHTHMRACTVFEKPVTYLIENTRNFYMETQIKAKKLSILINIHYPTSSNYQYN